MITILLIILGRFIFWGYLFGVYYQLSEGKPSYMDYILPLALAAFGAVYGMIAVVLIVSMGMKLFKAKKRLPLWNGIRYPWLGRVDVKLLNLVIDGWNWAVKSKKEKV